MRTVGTSEPYRPYCLSVWGWSYSRYLWYPPPRGRIRVAVLHNPPDRYGQTSQLSEQEVQDLERVE